MHLYSSRHRRGKSSRHRRQRRSARKSYTGKVRRRKRTYRTRRTRRTNRSKNKMYGGSNGLPQLALNTYRSTENNAANSYNKFVGNNLDNSVDPTLGHFP